MSWICIMLWCLHLILTEYWKTAVFPANLEIWEKKEFYFFQSWKNQGIWEKCLTSRKNQGIWETNLKLRKNQELWLALERKWPVCYRTILKSYAHTGIIWRGKDKGDNYMQACVITDVHTIHTSVFSFAMCTANTVFCISVNGCFKLDINRNYHGI